MESRVDFREDHRRLRRLLEDGSWDAFHRELLRHVRREDRTVFTRLRSFLLDPTVLPWQERRQALEELLSAPDNEGALALLDELVRVEEELIFPLARALKLVP